MHSNKSAHEAECKSSGVKWPASTSLKRKTLISFGFAETAGTYAPAGQCLLGFAVNLTQNPYGIWVLACKVKQVVGSFAFSQQHPATVQQGNLVKFGMLVKLLPIGANTSLL